MKKRAAVWIHGGIGTGSFSQGYSMLEKVLDRLSASFDIVVYSQAAPNDGYVNANYGITSAPANLRSGLMRWWFLYRAFRRDHRKHPFNFCLAFWGYPAGFIAVIAARLSGIHSAVYLLGSDSANVPEADFGIFHQRWPARIARWTYPRATLLLTISKHQEHNLRKFGISKEVIVIPWGADDEMFFPPVKTNADAQFSAAPDFGSERAGAKLRILHVGHLNPVKDQVTLLDTFSRIAKRYPAVLTILGVDTMDGALQRYAVKLGLADSVTFDDMVTYDQMPARYAAADIILQTSLSEGQSMSVTEAGACGVLVVSTRVGLMYDLGDDYGLLAEPRDAEGLALKIIYALEHPDEWQRITSNMVRWSQEHTLSWTIRELTRALDLL